MVGGEREIARFRSSVFGLLAARRALWLSSVYFVLWGTAVLVLRYSLRVDPFWLLTGAVGLAPLWAVAAAGALKALPSPAAVRAMLDGYCRCGGLLMADGETDLGDWRASLPPVARPRLRWRFGRRLLGLAAAAGFLCAAFLAPDRFLEQMQTQKLQIAGEMKKLTEQINTLKEEKILDVPKARAMEKSLQVVREEAKGDDPAKTLETLDHLQQALAKAAAEAAEQAAQRAEKAATAQQLAEAMKQAAERMDPKALGQAAKELSEMVNQAASENQRLAEGLSEELRQACKAGTLSEKQLQELARTLGECKAGELATLEKLQQAGLIDPSQLAELQEQCQGLGEGQQGQGRGEGDPQGLADMLAQADGEQAVADLLAELQQEGLPGRGGATRGRADAPMTWSGGTDEQGAKFKEQVLSPAAVASLKESRLQGVSLADPSSEKPGTGAAAPGALSEAAAGGGAAQTHRILPEYRGVVQRYFTRDRK